MDSSNSDEEWMVEDGDVEIEDGEDVVLNEIGLETEAEEISFTISERIRSISHKRKKESCWVFY